MPDERFDFVWVGLAILGLILLFPFDQAAQPLDPLGIALALGAGACWALYIVAGQKPSGVSGNHTVCLGMFVGMLILMPIALFAVVYPHMRLNPQTWFILWLWQYWPVLCLLAWK